MSKRKKKPYDPKLNPSPEVLKRILSERLTDDDLDEAAKITAEDIARVKKQMGDLVADLGDLDADPDAHDAHSDTTQTEAKNKRKK